MKYGVIDGKPIIKVKRPRIRKDLIKTRQIEQKSFKREIFAKQTKKYCGYSFRDGATPPFTIARVT
jgi:hypothetical protein